MTTMGCGGLAQSRGLSAGCFSAHLAVSDETNTCLTALARRARRVLPEDVGSASGKVAWLEPYPDQLLDGIADGPFRLRPIGANSQPAFELYGRSAEGSADTLQAIQVQSLHGNRIARLHGLVRPDLFSAFDLPLRLDEVDADR